MFFSHIREHLDGVIDMNQEDKMSSEETQFHYFKIHDYDHNNKLDGIELIAALSHFHKGMYTLWNEDWYLLNKLFT